MKVKINGKSYDFFDDVSLSKKLDAVATSFSLKARFNPENDEHKIVFKPLAYNLIEIYNDGGDLLVSGYSVNTILESASKRKLQEIAGYGKSGILEDCTIPISSYPLEKNKVTLDELVSSLIKDFGLTHSSSESVVIDMGLEYKKVVAGAGETVKSFISKQAAQRNIVVGHKADGNLFFFRIDTNASPKLLLSPTNTVSMSLGVDGQSMHSTISVIRQPSKDNPSLEPVDTIRNDMVKLERPIVKIMTSGTETDTKKAADNALAAELKSISISVILKDYSTIDCGDLVEIINPEIYIYKKTKMVVSELKIVETSKNEEMSLKLVLPETFTGEIPKNIFE